MGERPPRCRVDAAALGRARPVAAALSERPFPRHGIAPTVWRLSLAPPLLVSSASESSVDLCFLSFFAWSIWGLHGRIRSFTHGMWPGGYPGPQWWSSPGTVSIMEEQVSSACSRIGAHCGLAGAPLQGLLIVAYLPVQELSVPIKIRF